MASKPVRILDWISDDSASKYTTPSGAQQLAGHQDAVNADAKVFNWAWWRCSQWIEFLDNTFDSNGKDINAPKSTTITETITPTASCVTLDSGGIKSWDGSSNAIFSVTEAGAVTLGYSSDDVISLTAGVISVCTATSADLVKLHAITASYTEINQLTGVTVGGSSDGDIVTINASQTLTNKTLTTPKINEAVNLTSTSTELNQLDGVSVGGSSAGDIVTIDGTQTLTNKTINFSQVTGGTAPATRQYLLTGHDTTPAAIVYQGTTRYTKMSCNTAGTTMSVNPSTTNTVALNIGTSSYRYSSIGIYASSSGITIDTSGTIDMNASTGVTVSTTTSNSALTIEGSASNGILISGAANDGMYITTVSGSGVFVNNSSQSAFEVNNTSASGLYVVHAGTYGVHIVDADEDAIQVDAGYNGAGYAIRLGLPNNAYGPLHIDPTSTAPGTDFGSATGGSICTYNNGGTIELWFHDGSSWAKIA